MKKSLYVVVGLLSGALLGGLTLALDMWLTAPSDSVITRAGWVWLGLFLGVVGGTFSGMVIGLVVGLTGSRRLVGGIVGGVVGVIVAAVVDVLEPLSAPVLRWALLSPPLGALIGLLASAVPAKLLQYQR
jgi:hypothetical protein